MSQNNNLGCFPCPSIEQRNLLAIQRNSEAIAALTVSVQELSAKDVSLQAQIDEWSDTLDRKIVDGYRRLFEPDMQAERTARENADETLSNRIESLETVVPTILPTIQSTYATKADLSAVKETLQDEDIRLNTKIVTGDDAVKELLNSKVATLTEAISGNTASIGENKVAITNEKAAREDGDNSIRADVNATVGQIYATLRGEMEGIKTLLRTEFGSADTALDGKIAAAVARIEALEPVLARVGKLESDYSAVTEDLNSLKTKVNGFYHLTEEQWEETQLKIAENTESIESQGTRIDIELDTLRNRVTEIERILINT